MSKPNGETLPFLKPRHIGINNLYQYNYVQTRGGSSTAVITPVLLRSTTYECTQGLNW